MNKRVTVATFSLLAASVMAAAGLHAEDRTPDRRAVARASGSDSTLRDTVLELLRQLDAQGEEVKQLRNTTELQGHEIEQLKSQQRTLYDDLDKRLREAERRSTSGPVAPAIPSSPVAGTVAAPGTVTAAAAPSVPRVTTASQQQEYDAAFALMKQGLYERAIKAFRAFIAKYPESGLSDNSQYWIGHSYYMLLNYKLALEEFTKVLIYTQSPKVPDAQLMIGYCQYELGAYPKAHKALTEVQERYPGTANAKKAAARLEKMKKEGH